MKSKLLTYNQIMATDDFVLRLDEAAIPEVFDDSYRYLKRALKPSKSVQISAADRRRLNALDGKLRKVLRAVSEYNATIDEISGRLNAAIEQEDEYVE